MNKMNDKERMALSLSSSVKVIAGVWDAETQTWFGSRTKHPLQERRAAVPGTMRYLEQAPKGGWRSVEVPLVEDAPILCSVCHLAGMLQEHPELELAVETTSGEMVRVLSCSPVTDERRAYIPVALDAESVFTDAESVERYLREREETPLVQDFPWYAAQYWHSSVGGETLFFLPDEETAQRADALEYPQYVKCRGSYITTMRERSYCEAETVDGEVYTCLHHAPLYELVLERVCRVGVIAGKEGEKVKLAVGTK